MIIRANSPFRNIPLAIKQEQVILIDGLQYCVDMIEITFDRLWQNLYDFNYSKSELKPSHPSIFADAWQFICLADSLSNTIKRLGISPSDPLFEPFENISLMRNSFQHVDERLNSMDRFGQMPVFGSLSWYSQKMNEDTEGLLTVLFAGVFTNKKKAGTTRTTTVGGGDGNMVRGIQLKGIICLKNQEAREEVVDLSELFTKIRETVHYLEMQVMKQLSGIDGEHHRKDFFIQLHCNYDSKLVDEVMRQQD